MRCHRTALWSLLLLFVCLAAACGDSGAPATPTGEVDTGPKAGGTLYLSLGDDFVTFHPYYNVTNSEFKAQFFEAPIRISDDGDFEPWLAQSWEQAADGLSITLHLRHGVMFHNGREMTAEDVVWCVSHARDGTYGHNLSDRFQNVTAAETLDRYTVRIDYSERSASQLDAIARLYIFPQEALSTIATVPVGTGPFKFSEWIPGSSLTIERFADYWRKGFPYLDKVVVQPIISEEAQLAALRAQTIDLLMNVSLSDKAELATEEDMVVGADPPGFSFYAFIININAPPFDNMLVRQAFNYAINRQEIADKAFYGQAQPVTIPYPPSSWAYAKDLESYYTYDPEKAKALLAEAGYPAGFSIKMLVRGTEGSLFDQAVVYQQQLAAIGIHAELVPATEEEYWPQLYASDFMMVSHSTGDTSVDPSGLFETAACCRPFRSFFGIQYTQEELQKPLDQRVDRSDAWFTQYRDVIKQAREQSDRTMRKSLYHRALEIMLEQSWTIPTVWSQATYAHWNYVRNFRIDLDGTIWLGETWLAR
jgi:peptide/nickel transport system substrate-binding protein